MPAVEVYTQDWCPYCARVVSLLRKKGVAFQEIPAPHGSAVRAEVTGRTGRSTMPQVFIAGQHIGGCDDMLALDRAGKLDPLLQGS